MNLKSYIREFPDFPKPGINFKDISPLLMAPEAMTYIAGEFSGHFPQDSYDVIAGAESRGLIFASAFALHVGKSCIMVRKAGKLPGPTESIEYGLEYSDGILEVQKDAIHPGQRVLLVDDLLATGGTARAARMLIEKVGGQVIGYAFVIELNFLKGREVIGNYNIKTLVNYDE
jgi:adenine phosphoribosyltransferase